MAMSKFDEKKYRKVIKEYFGKLTKIFEEIEELNEQIITKSPVNEENLQEAIKIMDDEIDKSVIPQPLKVIMQEILKSMAISQIVDKRETEYIA